MKPTVDHVAEKTMLRAYSGEQKGATAFFRNRALLATLIDLLETEPHRLNVLFHASSIGPVVYSFAVYCRIRGLADLKIRATDINPDFLQYSRRARYPMEVLGTMTSQERAYFREADEAEVTPLDEIKEMIRFLPPVSFVDAAPRDTFELVFVTNAMTYITQAEQASAIDNIAGYNTRYLVVSAFHPDSIEQDLTRNGYAPVLSNISSIHNSWDERIREGPAPERGTPEYTWVLPPFSEIEGWRYKYCSIFQKTYPSE